MVDWRTSAPGLRKLGLARFTELPSNFESATPLPVRTVDPSLPTE